MRGVLSQGAASAPRGEPGRQLKPFSLSKGWPFLMDLAILIGSERHMTLSSVQHATVQPPAKAFQEASHVL
jgi:hypothetical protein